MRSMSHSQTDSDHSQNNSSAHHDDPTHRFSQLSSALSTSSNDSHSTFPDDTSSHHSADVAASESQQGQKKVIDSGMLMAGDFISNGNQNGKGDLQSSPNAIELMAIDEVYMIIAKIQTPVEIATGT